MIPDYIMKQYKVVSRLDKIKVYDSIEKLSDEDLAQIKKLIRIINYKLDKLDIDYDGFQVVLDVLYSIIKNQDVKFLIEYKGKNGEYSTLTHLVHFYLKDGFKGSINYYLDNGETIDEAIKKTAKFVYNTLKYQTVKYLGVFNLMYKFIISNRNNQKFEDIVGIDKLLVKFEYNALTEEGRIASDYGVPSKVVDYYENTDKQADIKKGFDNYELQSFEKVEKIINENK